MSVGVAGVPGTGEIGDDACELPSGARVSADGSAYTLGDAGSRRAHRTQQGRGTPDRCIQEPHEPPGAGFICRLQLHARCAAAPTRQPPPSPARHTSPPCGTGHRRRRLFRCRPPVFELRARDMEPGGKVTSPQGNASSHRCRQQAPPSAHRNAWPTDRPHIPPARVTIAARPRSPQL